MKKCPNCGSQMENDVNFCTVCGTDIRNVSPESNQADLEPKNKNVGAQKVGENTTTESNTRQTNQTISKVTEAVKNFDKDSLWNWFVSSWKTPSKGKKGEKWYGVVTLLLEMILFAWATGFGIKKMIVQLAGINLSSNNEQFSNNFNSIFHAVTMDLFLVVLILGAGIVIGSYFAHKFIYESNCNISFFDYTNKIVQLSNINAIIVLVLSLLSFVDYKGLISIISILCAFVAIVFLLAGAAAIHENGKSNRDYFWGEIIYAIIVLVAVGLAWLIVKNQVMSQFQSIAGNIGKLFFN